VIFHRHRHLASAIYSFAFTSLYFMFFLFMVQNTLQNLRLIDFFWVIWPWSSTFHWQ